MKQNTRTIRKIQTPKTNEKILKLLDEILETELSGVTRYLHYSLMITGPNRIPIVKFFRDQATEALQHATIIGEKITALGGHPSIRVSAVPETHKHSTLDILAEGLEFELKALQLYNELLQYCENNVALEELVREFIRTEQEHVEEVQKMLVVQERRS
jgi:bacterioferritin